MTAHVTKEYCATHNLFKRVPSLTKSSMPTQVKLPPPLKIARTRSRNSLTQPLLLPSYLDKEGKADENANLWEEIILKIGLARTVLNQFDSSDCLKEYGPRDLKPTAYGESLTRFNVQATLDSVQRPSLLRCDIASLTYTFRWLQPRDQQDLCHIWASFFVGRLRSPFIVRSFKLFLKPSLSAQEGSSFVDYVTSYYEGGAYQPRPVRFAEDRNMVAVVISERGTDLKAFVDKHSKLDPSFDSRLVKIMAQMMLGVKCLHDTHITHNRISLDSFQVFDSDVCRIGSFEVPTLNADEPSRYAEDIRRLGWVFLTLVYFHKCDREVPEPLPDDEETQTELGTLGPLVPLIMKMIKMATHKRSSFTIEQVRLEYQKILKKMKMPIEDWRDLALVAAGRTEEPTMPGKKWYSGFFCC